MSPAELEALIKGTRDIIPLTSRNRATRTADLAAYLFACSTKILAEHGITESEPRVKLVGHMMKSYDQLEYRQKTWDD